MHAWMYHRFSFPREICVKKKKTLHKWMTKWFNRIQYNHDIITILILVCVAGGFNSFGAHDWAVKPRMRWLIFPSPPHFRCGFAACSCAPKLTKPSAMQAVSILHTNATDVGNISLFHTVYVFCEQQINFLSTHISENGKQIKIIPGKLAILTKVVMRADKKKELFQHRQKIDVSCSSVLVKWLQF